MTKYLTKEEELELGQRVQNMVEAKKILRLKQHISTTERTSLIRQVSLGEDAVEILTKANEGLVYAQAKTFKAKYPGAPELEDLIQDGMAGLVTAIYRYDPKLNNKLSTLATYWIFQSMSRWTNKTGRLVKLPENRITDFTHITKLRNKYEEMDIPRADADKLIMDELNLTQKDMFFITGAASTPTSLNRKVSQDDDAKELIDFFAEESTVESSEDHVMKNTTNEIISHKLNNLSDIQRDVILSSFALYEENSLTTKQVKEKYGISSAKFKKILQDCLLNLKADFKDIGMDYQDFMN